MIIDGFFNFVVGKFDVVDFARWYYQFVLAKEHQIVQEYKPYPFNS